MVMYSLNWLTIAVVSYATEMPEVKSFAARQLF